MTELWIANIAHVNMADDGSVTIVLDTRGGYGNGRVSIKAVPAAGKALLLGLKQALGEAGA